MLAQDTDGKNGCNGVVRFAVNLFLNSYILYVSKGGLICALYFLVSSISLPCTPLNASLFAPPSYG